MAMNLGSFASRVIATKVVATDGTGDFTDIQSAIDDLPSSGGVVYVKEGTYTITSPITFISNMALIGAGSATIITATTNINKLAPGNVSKCFISQLTIRGSNVDNVNNRGILVNNFTESVISNCWIEQNVRGINNFSTSPSLNISSCFIFDNIRGGIDLTGGFNIKISDCVFENNGGVCIRMNNPSRIVITGNIFKGPSGAISYTAVFGSVISGNEIEGTTGTAINIEDDPFGADGDNIIICGNTIENVTNGQGISLDDAPNTVISGNIIHNCGEDGIKIITDSGNTIISGNRCYANSGFGINIATSSTGKTLVHGNHLLGNTAGALQDNGTNTILADNVTV